ncbi:hypothetical protein AQV86_04345 [Nanohaloarchaea archaeon SG9]|nr:hypothetical protein AQV86_04345 [Nanohaloarchaea archaeon SG9]
MRVLLKLSSLKDQAYNPSYHVDLQGAVYRKLEEAGLEDVHDNRPFKFFSFSNVFPPEDIKQGDNRTFILASSNRKIVEKFAEVSEKNDRLEFGEQQYSIKDTSKISVDPGEKGKMITGTPIVVRIAKEKAAEYGIEGNHQQIYWKMKHDSQAFIDRIEENLAHKYETYYNREPPDRPYFTGYTPRKEVAVPLKYAEGTDTVVGTTWELEYECHNREMYRLIQMAYDSGLGELNATGFGFMNKVND